MNIRDNLVSKKRKYFYAGAIPIFFGTVSFQGWVFTNNDGLAYLGLLLYVLGTAGFIAHKFFVLCPRCHGNIGLGHNDFTNTKRFFTKPVACCPFCGVGLDERVVP